MSVENFDKKKENGQEVEKCGNNAISEELQNFQKICSSRCSICSSGALAELHGWRKDGAEFGRMAERAKNEFNIEISVSALSRHFKTYRAFKVRLATDMIKNDVIEEITSQSVHIKKTVELLDLAYAKIKTMMEANTYKIDISDLEKLAKMRYQILNGDSFDDKEIMAIFQKATSDYGLDIQQGVLFKM